MSVTTIGTTGAVWGLSAETGIIVQRHSASNKRDINEVRNHEGEVALVAFYNAFQEGSLEGIITGSTGIATAAPGVALTVANEHEANGVTTGGVYTTQVDVNGANTEFKTIAVNYKRWPLIA